MEEGSLRCDANISLRPVGQTTFGTKTELKNMNTFSGVQRALEYEEKRQAKVLDAGQKSCRKPGVGTKTGKKPSPCVPKKKPTITVTSRTPIWSSCTFPEEWMEDVRRSFPKCPMPAKSGTCGNTVCRNTTRECSPPPRNWPTILRPPSPPGLMPKSVSNWVMVELLGYMNKHNLEIEQVKMPPQHLGTMIQMIEKGTISGKIAKTVFADMLESGKDPETIVKEKGLVQISDEGALREIVQKVIENNPQSVSDYLNGKDRALGFLVGQVMKETKGKANPQLVNKLLVEALKK